VRLRSHFSWGALVRAGKLIFAQLTEFAADNVSSMCRRYGGSTRSSASPAASSFCVSSLAQLTYRESLRDIEMNLFN